MMKDVCYLQSMQSPKSNTKTKSKKNSSFIELKILNMARVNKCEIDID